MFNRNVAVLSLRASFGCLEMVRMEGAILGFGGLLEKIFKFLIDIFIFLSEIKILAGR